MNSANLSTLLRQLVLERDMVSLPGMGYFEVKDVPSELINNGKGITPPVRKIVFESSVEYNDNVLAERYAKVAGVSQADANAQVAELLRQLKKELIDNAKATLPEFGTLYFGESGSFAFEPVPDLDFESDSYCLEPLLLKAKGGAAEVLVAEPEEENVIDMVELIEVLEEDSVEEGTGVGAETETETRVETETETGAETGTEAETGVEAVAVPERRGVSKVILVLLSIVAIFVILIILLLLFKEELMPLLEKILYSKEELEILRRANL